MILHRSLPELSPLRADSHAYKHIFPARTQGWSVGYTMLIFAGLNIINLLFVLFCIKETKGVPLEEIPALFK